MKSLAAASAALALFGFGLIGCSDDGDSKKDDKIALSQTSVTLMPGESVELTLNKGSSPITSGVTWAIDDVTIASVSASDSCVATVALQDGVSSGSAELTATYNGKDYTATVTASDISLPIEITLGNTFVADEFGALTPSQTKETYDGSGLNTWDTGTAEVRTSVGMYVLANASGLIKNPREGDNLVTYYYGSGDSSAAAVGDTLAAAGLKSYLAFSAAQLKTDSTSVKLTINAHGVDYDHDTDNTAESKFGTIGIIDSSDNKVLAISDTLTAEEKDYTFYVKPSTRLVITNVGKDGTSISFNSITAEASDNAVTATGSIAVETITLNETTLSGTAGGSASLTATVSPSTATDVSLSWTSSDTTVAKLTVAEDTLSATVEYVAAGTATITVASGSVKAEAAVTVTAASAPITAIAIEGTATIDLYNNETPTTTLTATVTPTDTDVTSLSWESSDTSIATVEATSTIANGTSSVTVTAAGKVGTATITAKSGSVSKTFDVTVSASGASWKGYNIYSLAKAVEFADGSSDDGTVAWKNIEDNGSPWIKTSDTSEISIALAGASIVTIETYDGTHKKALTVTDSDSNKLVDAVVSTGITNSSSRKDVAFIYTGTTATTVTISVTGLMYISQITVADGSEAANGVSSVSVTGNGTIVTGNSATYTATATAKYVNTDNNEFNASTLTTTWAVSGSDAASISGDGVLTVTGLTEDATLTVKATVGGVSGTKSVEATAVAATSYDKVTWAFNTYSSTLELASLYTDSALTTTVQNGTAGYCKDATYSLPLYINTGTSGKFQIRSEGDAQVNADTTVYIPVSAGSVVTLTHNYSATYTLNGTACSGTAAYTATSAGYLAATATASSYFYKIEVTNLAADDALSFDTAGKPTNTQASGSVTSGAVTE